jgi:pimeloyl-ACP methyl ester carboxylesterase
MTIAGAVPVIASWDEPAGIAPRGTVVVVPGRGEHPVVYERFGRRIAADGYRVHAVPDPVIDAERVVRRITTVLDDAPGPVVLAGSDSGALFAALLVAEGALPAGRVAGLLLAGLPTPVADRAAAASSRPDWEQELEVRTACPTHQARLRGDDAVRRGELTRSLPAEWFARARPSAIGVPVLGLHGGDDAISPLAAARNWYAQVPTAQLVSIAGGRHDALNDQTHRTAAASVVLFLERLRLRPDVPGADLPEIAREEIGIRR